MSSVFKQGDVAYHAHLGKVTVKYQARRTDFAWYVYSETTRNTYVIHQDELSFKPWPAACHERPKEEGAWAVRVEHTRTYVVRFYKDGKWYAINKHNHQHLCAYDCFIPVQKLDDSLFPPC